LFVDGKGALERGEGEVEVGVFGRRKEILSKTCLLLSNHEQTDIKGGGNISLGSEPQQRRPTNPFKGDSIEGKDENIYIKRGGGRLPCGGGKNPTHLKRGERGCE